MQIQPANMICSMVVFAKHERYMQVAAKPAAVKDEPLSSAAVKTEPHTSGQKKQSNKSTSKDAADVKQKRVIVKKEYDMPGQTKDTPLEVSGIQQISMWAL